MQTASAGDHLHQALFFHTPQGRCVRCLVQTLPDPRLALDLE